jgi:hypothetical protein
LVSSEQKRLPLVWFQIARPGAFVALPHAFGRESRSARAIFDEAPTGTAIDAG